jgi:RimJ/RimL family protein N-acetyltransferase
VRPHLPVDTVRLTLRPFREDDFDDVFPYMSDPSVVRYLYWEVRDEAATRDVLKKREAEGELAEDGHSLGMALQSRADGRVVGEVMLRLLSKEHRQGELGYVMNPAHQGRGYAREAAQAALRIGFEQVGLHRIIARCDTRNVASWKVMERLGMRREAHFVQDELFKGEWSDTLVYAMLADEWRAVAP